ASARKGSPARALELEIPPETLPVYHFPEQHRATITELRNERAELMAGIRLSKRFRRLRQVVSGQHRDPIGPFEPLGIDAELLRERPIDADQRGRCDGRRATTLEQPLGQLREGGIEKAGQGTIRVARQWQSVA